MVCYGFVTVHFYCLPSPYHSPYGFDLTRWKAYRQHITRAGNGGGDREAVKKQEIKVEEKTDNTLTYEEIITSYFHADDSVKRRFLIQPKIKGAPGFSTTYQDNSTFSGRRLTAVNCGLSNLYRMAYGDFPYNRTVDKIPASEKEAYCIDLIVPRQKELLAELKKELAVRFDVHAEVATRTKRNVCTADS